MVTKGKDGTNIQKHMINLPPPPEGLKEPDQTEISKALLLPSGNLVANAHFYAKDVVRVEPYIWSPETNRWKLLSGLENGTNAKFPKWLTGLSKGKLSWLTDFSFQTVPPVLEICFTSTDLK